MTSKGLPKSTKNRSWGHLGLQDAPKMLQESLRHPIWTIFDRFLIDFGPKFDRFWTEFGQKSDRSSTEFGIDFAIISILFWVQSLTNIRCIGMVLAQFAFGKRALDSVGIWKSHLARQASTRSTQQASTRHT